MIARILSLAVAATLVLGTATIPTVAFAQAKKEETKKAETKKEAKKELTPQQQKMKDCSGKWNDEKKAKKVSGKKAHNEFMSGCLKG